METGRGCRLGRGAAVASIAAPAPLALPELSAGLVTGSLGLVSARIESTGPVSRKTWIARFGENTGVAAWSLRVQSTSGDGTSSVVKKTRLAVVTTYW